MDMCSARPASTSMKRNVLFVQDVQHGDIYVPHDPMHLGPRPITRCYAEVPNIADDAKTILTVFCDMVFFVMVIGRASNYN